jgi:uncharacterized membrane protein YvbJ
MRCPYCAGEIEEGVLKCKHCGEWLDKEHRQKEENVKEAQQRTGDAVKYAAAFILILILLGVIGNLAGACN